MNQQTGFTYAAPGDPIWRRALIRAVEKATGRPQLERLYKEYRGEPAPRRVFFDAALDKLRVTLDVDPAALDAVPASGPLVVVANHPFGVLDGLAACHLVGRVRSDYLILANSVLGRAEEMRPYLLPVDFSGTREALAANIHARAAARDHLRGGGALIVFPAGAVSTTPSLWGRHAAKDAPWGPFTGQLVQRARAPVLPLFFEGQNGSLFQMASHLSQSLRLSLLFRETATRIGSTLRVVVGDALPYETLAALGTARDIAHYLEEHTYRLAAAMVPEAHCALP